MCIATFAEAFSQSIYHTFPLKIVWILFKGPTLAVMQLENHCNGSPCSLQLWSTTMFTWLQTKPCRSWTLCAISLFDYISLKDRIWITIWIVKCLSLGWLRQRKGRLFAYFFGCLWNKRSVLIIPHKTNYIH